MGLNLSGLGQLLRRGADDVGSYFTGQPAQSNPTPVAQPQPQHSPLPTSQGGSGFAAPIRQQIRFQPQQVNPLPIVNQNGQSTGKFPGYNGPLPQTPNQTAMPKLAPLQIRPVTNPTLDSTPQLPPQNNLHVGVAPQQNLHIGNQVIAPNPHAQVRPDNTLQLNALLHPSLASQVEQGLQQKLQVPLAAASQAHEMAQQFFTRPAAELANSFNPRQATYHPNSSIEHFIFGQTPVQNVEKNVANNYDTHSNLPTPLRYGLAAADTVGQALNVIPDVSLVAKSAKEAAPAIRGIADQRVPLNESGAVGKNAKEPVPEPLPRSQQSGYALSKPSVPKQSDIDSYANTFDVPKAQAKQTLSTLKQSDNINPPPKVTPLEADATAQADLPAKLSQSERRAIIEQDAQKTHNQINTDVTEGNTHGAIAKAEGIEAERQSLFKDAIRDGNKSLDKHDQALLSERADPNVQIKPHDPEAFKRVTSKLDNAYDYHLAADRAAGGTTFRFGGGKYSPLYLKATPEQMDKLGIPAENRFQKNGYTGFRDATRKYRSYSDAGRVGLKPLNDNPLKDAEQYAQASGIPLRNALLRQTLSQSNPHEISATGMGVEENGRLFKQAAGANLPFNVSENLDKYLNNYKKAYTPTSAIGKGVEKAIQFTGSATKKSLFSLSAFHQAHISENVGFASIMGGEPKAFSEGLLNAAKQGGGLSTSKYYEVLDHYRQDGTLRYARNMGINLPEHSALDRFVNSYALSLAKVAKRGGIEEGSQEAVDLGKIYNHLLGRENAAVEGVNPTIEKFTSYFALAPHYLRTQLELVKEAMLPKKLGGAGYDKPTSLLTPGGAARSAVLGPRLFGAMFAVTASAIITRHFPTWQDVRNEAGLNPNNTNPNIQIKSKNSKGESQVMNLPTDPIGLAVGFVTDPKHFFQSRYSPAISFGVSAASNRNYKGDYLVDPTQPNSPKNLAIRAEKAAEGSFLPIGIQNFTNPQKNPNNPNVKQGIAQEVGFRLKTNPNDPKVIATKQYFNQLNTLKNKFVGTNAQQDSATATKFVSRNKTPDGKTIQQSEANTISNWSDVAGNQKVLTSLQQFYKSQASHNPEWDLSGQGKLNGQSVDKLQLWARYKSLAPGDIQKDVIAQQNPWIAQTNAAIATWAQGLQVSGNSVQAPGYIPYPTPDSDTQGKLSQITKISTILAADRTPEQIATLNQLENDPNVQQSYQNQQSYTNAVRNQLNLPEIQYAPNSSPEVQNFTNAYLGGTKADRTTLKANNPALYNQMEQALETQQLDSLNKQGAVGYYGGQQSPSYLGNIYNLGQYDITPQTNANGTKSYNLTNFTGAGGTGQNGLPTISGAQATAAKASSGSGGSSKKVKIYRHYVKPIRIQHARREHHTRSHSLKTPYSNLAFNNKSKQTLKIADNSKSHIKLG